MKFDKIENEMQRQGSNVERSDSILMNNIDQNHLMVQLKGLDSDNKFKHTKKSSIFSEASGLLEKVPEEYM